MSSLEVGGKVVEEHELR